MKIQAARFEAAATAINDIPPAGGPEIALAGRSNVGKSSLVNMLAGRKSLARTSRTPGCTRGLIFFRLDDGLRLVDLPGYGYARRSQSEKKGWRVLVNHYLANREQLAGVLILFDVRRGPQDEELELADFAQEQDLPRVFVATKCDKLKRAKLSLALRGLREQLSPTPVIQTSVLNRWGRRELWSWLSDLEATPTANARSSSREVGYVVDE